jgi:diguanylate cyclase (GGDEF)-like protein
VREEDLSQRREGAQNSSNMDTQIDDLWPLFESAYDGVLLLSGKTWQVLRANRVAAEWLGHSQEQLVGRVGPALFLEESRPALLQQFEAELGAASNEGPVQAKLMPIERRKRLVVVRSCRIVWKGESALGVWLFGVHDSERFYDMPDPLARWRDRSILERRLRELMHEYDPPKQYALLFIDLDNFKAVNDRHGHIWGDRNLNAVANGIAGCLRDGDLVARYGGDEFLVLIEKHTDIADVENLVVRIQAAVGRPLSVPGATIELSASVGVAWASPEFRKPEDAIAAADRAMYAAKRAKARVSGDAAGEPAR